LEIQAVKVISKHNMDSNRIMRQAGFKRKVDLTDEDFNK